MFFPMYPACFFGWGSSELNRYKKWWWMLIIRRRRQAAAAGGADGGTATA